MSNTRNAAVSAPLSQEKYMSSPEYVALRGISGNAATEKARVMNHPAKRSLILFLQALSLRPGGLQKVCQDFVAMFPDRIGTPAMHAAGIKPGKTYDQKTANKIWWEILSDDDLARAAFMDEEEDAGAAKQRRSVDCLLSQCRAQLATLENFIFTDSCASIPPSSLTPTAINPLPMKTSAC